MIVAAKPHIRAAVATALPKSSLLKWEEANRSASHQSLRNVFEKGSFSRTHRNKNLKNNIKKVRF